MDGINRNRKAFIAKLARENRKFYEIPDGRAALRAFDLTFEHRWIYLFELVQNALDAGAHSIAFRLAENSNTLIFQHDGNRSLDEKDVEGLSKIFRSTKRASSVGFMGIGFKSVFGRFQEARISGWGWTFRYQVSQVVGERFGDVQPDLLGAVIPIWDDAIAAPEPEFTTRFEMHRQVDTASNLKSDLAHFLPDDDRTLLAILAASGLERLEIDSREWELGVSEEVNGSLEATARSDDENLLWQLFPVQFEPSEEAIARFLEYRKIQPTEEEREQVYTDAARPRRVLGLLPLDNDGMPAPPRRGRVYATLPTEVTLPFGLHINADWMVNISRSGLREIEDNAWQWDIADHIADVLTSFLDWVAHSCPKPDAAKRAFSVLASPVSNNTDGLEKLLATNRWLSRLRTQLQDVAVLPVWTVQANCLRFAKPSETIVPPAPLRKAFEEQLALQPTVLMKGAVLRSEVLGSNAFELLSQTGLVTEVSPRTLERSWSGGLEDWWKTLTDKVSDRQALLFRLWGAVAEVTSQETWRAARLPCFRTAAGTWVPVDRAIFFNELLPTESEPGGSETRQFIQLSLSDPDAHLPSHWIVSLRQAAGAEKISGPGPLSRAQTWLEAFGQSIKLSEAVKDAMSTLEKSPNPDWSVLLPFGRWALHRNRPELLTHVLVESENGPKGIAVKEALIADPYVENGWSRRRLFATMPTISSIYLEKYPEETDARKWRVFFEKAGVQGTLTIQEKRSPASRYSREEVAKFLGIVPSAVDKSNDSGYALLDFDIKPSLPKANAPEGQRAALSVWLEDGFTALRGKRLRKASFHYHSPRQQYGNRQNSWVVKLTELEWVPCNDNRLRRPKDVLPQSDPVRKDVPAANLSTGLIQALNQEGIRFGAAIPDAPALRRLSVVGPSLNAEELAGLLREVREQVETAEDSRHFGRFVQGFAIPLGGHRRIPLNRVVRRIGGRYRSALGGWVGSLAEIQETLREQLEHSDFPYEFPETTTGKQALEYILNVWTRTVTSSEPLANEVRDVLPVAYAYCLEEVDQNAAFSRQWKDALAKAAVFAEREWVLLANAEEPVYFDDLEDRRFFPSQVQLRTATSGHLGNSLPHQRRTAMALGLKSLSSVVEMEWNQVGAWTVADWSSRFKLICGLLLRARTRGSERTDERNDTGTEREIQCVERLDLTISVNGAPAEPVPVNARLHAGALSVAGRPVQFASDAAKELLRDFSFRQRGDLASDLTGMLVAIDNESDFKLAVAKFGRSYVPDFTLPGSPDRTVGDPVNERSEFGEVEDANERGEEQPISGVAIHDAEGSDNGSGSFRRERALAKQRALTKELEKSLKGEIEPNVEKTGLDEVEQSERNVDGSLGDEIYRRVAAQYEMEAGRKPEIAAPNQTGWDIRSVDPTNGLSRLIEVKGKGGLWTEDEVVELSQAQVRIAWRAGDESVNWYLYVVERTNDGRFTVLPIRNPVQRAGKWILCGQSWRMLAEESRQVNHSDLNPDC